MNALTKDERQLRDVHIEVIRQGMSAVEEVARSLIVLRDKQLYRETHASFEAFCRDTFSIGKSRAYQLIEWVETKDELSTTVDTTAMNERQARELNKLPEEERAEVWQEAIADGEPTAAKIAEIVERKQVVPDTHERPQESTSYDTCDMEDFIQRLQDCIDEEWEAGQLGKSQIVDSVYKAAVYAKGLK